MVGGKLVLVLVAGGEAAVAGGGEASCMCMVLMRSAGVRLGRWNFFLGSGERAGSANLAFSINHLELEQMP